MFPSISPNVRRKWLLNHSKKLGTVLHNLWHYSTPHPCLTLIVRPTPTPTPIRSPTPTNHKIDSRNFCPFRGEIKARVAGHVPVMPKPISRMWRARKRLAYVLRHSADYIDVPQHDDEKNPYDTQSKRKPREQPFYVDRLTAYRMRKYYRRPAWCASQFEL